MSEQPLLLTWTGEELRPASPWWVKKANEQLIVGERYLVETLHERSAASHRHYFAAINEAFQNLPDEMRERFATSEALRKYALIKAGFRDERSVVCQSYAEALRIAAFVRPLDDHAIVSVSGATVVVLTAKSQSFRAMGKRDFQRSKDEVLRVIAELVGVSADVLQRNSGRAA